jgi:hypothetical protein
MGSDSLPTKLATERVTHGFLGLGDKHGYFFNVFRCWTQCRQSEELRRT